MMSLMGLFVYLFICLESFSKIQKTLSGRNQSFIQTPGPFYTSIYNLGVKTAQGSV